MTDYFLYDNRTWAAKPGTDWGLKATTGLLASQKGWQRTFVDYCTSVGSQAHPKDFGAAIGGLRLTEADSYLVCVILEQPDRRGRPSWAVVGFYFRSQDELGLVLRDYDVIGTARVVSDSEEKPPAAVFLARGVRGLLPAPQDWIESRVRRARPMVARFRGSESAGQVEGLLLDCLEHGRWLPSILGILALKRLDLDSLRIFDLVLCHPVDESSAETLLACIAAQRVRLDTPTQQPPGASGTNASALLTEAGPRSNPALLTSAISFRQLPMVPVLVGLSLFVILLVSMAIWGMPVPDASENTSIYAGERATASEKESPDVAKTLRGSPSGDRRESVGERRGSEPDALRAFERVVEDLTHLDPEKLVSSVPFRLAEEVPVAREFERDRQGARNAFRRLLGVRKLAVNLVGNSLDYFTKGAGRGLSADERLAGMQKILAEWSGNEPDCDLLRQAFGFAFEEGRTELSVWCEASAGLKALR